MTPANQDAPRETTPIRHDAFWVERERLCRLIFAIDGRHCDIKPLVRAIEYGEPMDVNRQIDQLIELLDAGVNAT